LAITDKCRHSEGEESEHNGHEQCRSRECRQSFQHLGPLRVNNDWSDETTDNPLNADDRNFYKVEKWTKDGTKVDRLLYAGNNLEKAQEIFRTAIQHRPRIRLTIRQRTRLLEQWPQNQ
jgi:hypothetical protein